MFLPCRVAIDMSMSVNQGTDGDLKGVRGRHLINSSTILVQCDDTTIDA